MNPLRFCLEEAETKDGGENEGAVWEAGRCHVLLGAMLLLPLRRGGPL